ncbi:MAG: hypothetical protein LBB82_03775, partial [Treponema sp.]|nr:hypothetical protein [Treponema sp.]
MNTGIKNFIASLAIISQLVQIGAAFNSPENYSGPQELFWPVSGGMMMKEENTAARPAETNSAAAEENTAEAPVPGQAKISLLVKADEGADISLESAGIHIPPYALDEDTEISIVRLSSTAATGDDMENVTAGGGGYRFLPAGTRFRIPVTVRIPYKPDLSASEAALEGMNTYFYNTETNSWEALNRIALDAERCVLASAAMHFTDMINGTLTMPEGPKPLSFNINSIKGLEAADPGAGVLQLRGLEANYTGAGSFSVELETPPGRAGMQPGIAVGYSSDGGNGVMGRGFALEAGSEITYDTRRGLPDYGAAETQKGTFALDGVQLVYRGKSGDVYSYRARKETAFERIRHVTGTSDYWEVTDKNGTVRIYGLEDGAGKSWGGRSAAEKYRWLLESVTDSFGNRIRYEYFTDANELYLKTIYYTEHEGADAAYRVEFAYEDGRPDIRVDGRGGYISETRKLLKRIDEFQGASWIRGYLCTYREEPVYGVKQLVSFGQASGESGEEYFWKYDFSYIEFPKNGTSGEYLLYGGQERWEGGAPIQKSESESAGANMTVSTSGGIGLEQVDVRVSGAVQLGSSSGETATEHSLVDINGDGRPDLVWMSGGALKARINGGDGFAAEAAFSFEGGPPPQEVGRESQSQSNSGFTLYGGAGVTKNIVSAGVSYNRVTQRGWTDTLSGFADINGDGLPDIVISHAGYYWRNAGTKFVRTAYTGDLPPDNDALFGEDAEALDKAYYQQAPLRQWRSPLSGTLTVRQEITPLDAMSGDGLGAYTYFSGDDTDPGQTTLLQKTDLPGIVPDRTIAVNGGDSLYFVSDGHKDLRGDDVRWNVRINYETVRLFEDAGFREERYGEKDPARSTAEHTYYNYFQVPVPLAPDSEQFKLLVERAAGRGEAYVTALFTYYRFDTAKQRYVYNDKAKAAAGILDTKRKAEQPFTHGVSELGTWNGVIGNIKYLLESLDGEERAFVTRYTWPVGERRDTPFYDSGRDDWFIAETGSVPLESWDVDATGYLAGTVIALDRIDGKILYYDTAGGKAYYDGAELSAGASGASVVIFGLPWYAAYALNGYRAYPDELTAAQMERLQSIAQGESYTIAAWQRVEQPRYDDLLASLDGEDKTFVESRYTFDSESGQYDLSPLPAAERERFDNILFDFAGKMFFEREFPWYEESGGTYRVKTLDADQRAALESASRAWGLAGYTGIVREIRFYSAGIYPVVGGNYIALPGRDETLDISPALRWNSADDYSSRDLAVSQVFTAGGTVRKPETVEILSGGNKGWFYGIWLGEQSGDTLFNAAKLASERERYRVMTEKEMEDEQRNVLAAENAKTPAYTFVRTAELLEVEEGDWRWTIESEAETGISVADETAITEGRAVLSGPPTIVGTDYYAPFIAGDRLHGARVGGPAYYQLPGIAGPAGGGGMMGYLRKSSSKGTDVTRGVSVSASIPIESVNYAETLKSAFSKSANFSGTNGTNTSDSNQTQALQDINGDGYADILQSAGGLMVTAGNRGNYSRSYMMSGAGAINVQHTSLDTGGGSFGASGSATLSRTGTGGVKSVSMTGGGGGSITRSTGSNEQRQALVDINGDGLPDALNGSAPLVNTGLRFEARNYGAPWSAYSLQKSRSESAGFSLSLKKGLGGGDQPGDGENAVGGNFDIDVDGSVNFGESFSATEAALMDVNGDGLPDMAVKAGTYFNVRFNNGSSFGEARNFPVSDWYLFGEEQDAKDRDGPNILNAVRNTPIIGGILDGMGLDRNFYRPAGDVIGGMNGLDYSGSYSTSFSGGLNAAVQISIPLLPVGVPRLNIGGAQGMSVTLSKSTGTVKVQTMDMDGDGLADRVLDITGDGGHVFYVRKNLARDVGLLDGIATPQGGNIELEYGYKYGTAEMPQGKHVLSRVTKKDNDGKDGRIALDYESAHGFSVEYEYEDGYYDREEKENYGFEKVTTVMPDGTRQQTFYTTGVYPLKGMPYRQAAFNGGWSKETFNKYHDGAALLAESKTIVSEGGGTIENTQYYDYDFVYGNVTRIKDEGGEGTETLEAVIAYGSPNDAKYFHAHPTGIIVKSGGKTVRERYGAYDSATGALVSLRQETGTADPDVVSAIRWNAYGGLDEIRDANNAYVRYEYDSTYKQFPETITRGGSGVSEYSSGIEWNKVFGVKAKETDENGQVIRYEYDPYGRLKEVYSPCDTAMPAVAYEYYGAAELPGGGNWYAVTTNKISFDGSNADAIQTVIVTDGLGRAIVTAKTGEIRLEGRAATGWNIGGGVSYDEKGRAVAQGQPEFIEWETVDAVLAFNYPARGAFHNGLATYGLRLPTVSEYDTQDRPVRVTLPDGAAQTTAYAISGGHSMVTNTDPLGNISVQYADSRQNIVKTERYNKDKVLQTRATYVYNAMGEMLAALDFEGNPLTVEYDLMGRRTAMQSEDMGRKEYRYDKAGNLERETDSVLRGRGEEIAYVYDGLNRLTKIDYPRSTDTVYEYGAPGAADGTANRIKKLTDESGSIEYKYGALGETTEEKRGIKNLNPVQTLLEPAFERTMNYRSNYLGQLEWIRYGEDSETVEYAYNRGGLVNKVTGKKPSAVESDGTFEYARDIGYDEFGQRVFIEYGNGVSTGYEYNPERRRLDRIVTCSPGGGKVYQDIRYQINEVGNVES